MKDHLVKKLMLKPEVKLKKELEDKRVEDLLLLKAKGALQTHLAGRSYLCIALYSVVREESQNQCGHSICKRKSWT